MIKLVDPVCAYAVCSQLAAGHKGSIDVLKKLVLRHAVYRPGKSWKTTQDVLYEPCTLGFGLGIQLGGGTDPLDMAGCYVTFV